MQFPKVLFSPAGAVDPKDFDVISQQGKSAAAEAAIKLTVYKKKGDDVEVATAEPTLRESTKRPAAATTDASDVIKKWSKK